jgi:hypothetical protein
MNAGTATGTGTGTDTDTITASVVPGPSIAINSVNSWPTLSTKFSEIMNDKNGLRGIQNSLSARANAAKMKQADADATKIRGPVTLVMAGLRGMSRILSVPLTALEGESSLEPAPSVGYMMKITHTIVLLMLSALIYVVYTNIIFTHVSDENTFVIVSTMAWMMCLLLIGWLAT